MRAYFFWAVSLVLAVSFHQEAALSQNHFVRGDVDGDGVIALSDAVQLLRSLDARSALTCPDAADFNDNGVVNLGDYGYLIEHILTGQPSPQPPFAEPGHDPTPDDLLCVQVVPPSVENGGSYSFIAEPAGGNLRLRVLLENTAPAVAGSATVLLPAGWDLGSKVIDVKPSLELLSVLGQDSTVTANFRLDGRLTVLWLVDAAANRRPLPPGAMRPVFDLVVCPGRTPPGVYSFQGSEPGEVIDELGKGSTASVQSTSITIESLGPSCAEVVPTRLTVRPYAWMDDTEARIGDVFRVRFLGMSNREYRDMNLQIEWDVDVLRVVGIEKVRPETTLHGLFMNVDGLDPTMIRRQHLIEGPYYEVSYCDPCNSSGASPIFAFVSVRNYHWSGKSGRPEEEVLFPANQEFPQFDLVFQVLPAASVGETEIKLAEDPEYSGAPGALGDAEAENYINFFWADAADELRKRIHIRPRPLSQGHVTILAGAPPTSFIRGDVNLDGELSLTDVVTLLSNLFLGSTFVIRCPDSADTNDDGSLDVSDAVSILGFLFLGTAKPRPPYPFPATDPTEDNLPCGG